MTGKQVLILVFCLLSLIAYQSCKKGCTDKKALNYASGAKDNDGTCLYCDSSLQLQNANETEIEDLNSFQEVLLLFVESKAVTYTGNGCQKYNLGNSNTSSCVNTTHDGYLLNTTGQTIVFTGQITITYESQQQLLYNFNSVQIGPLDTLKVANFGSLCVQPFGNFFQLNVQQGYTIQYK